MIELDREAPDRTLAVFGAALAVLFAGAGLAVRLRLGLPGASFVVWAGGAAVCAVYVAGGRGVRRRIYVAWQLAVSPIGWVVGHALMGLIFFGVVTPIGLALRAMGHDPLALRKSDEASCWRPRRPTSDPTHYFRRF